MSSIVEMPCEVIGGIFKNLGDLDSLESAILTCRHFYVSYHESHGVEATILSRQITPALLPYSIAQIGAEHLVVHNTAPLLNDLETKPASYWVEKLAELSKSEKKKMSRLYCMVETMAMEFGARAWEHIPNTPEACPRFVLLPSEYFRFCRIFYRVELCTSICSKNEFGNQGCSSWFLQRYPPWENEQMACVYEYLGASFLESK